MLGSSKCLGPGPPRSRVMNVPWPWVHRCKTNRSVSSVLRKGEGEKVGKTPIADNNDNTCMRLCVIVIF